MINRVENKLSSRAERADPEVQAGRTLRRLREARNWTQEEVAKRMQAFGYDFHQTMIAKIEGAQRPLRVRELADFAALYGVQVQDLIHPPSTSPGAAGDEFAQLEDLWMMAEDRVRASAQRVAELRESLAIAQAESEKYSREQATLEARMDFLRQEMGISWVGTKPDPAVVETAAGLFEALQQLRYWAGNPSYNTMADRVRNALPATQMRMILSAAGWPSAAQVATLVTACDGTDQDVEAFVAAWQRVESAHEFRKSSPSRSVSRGGEGGSVTRGVKGGRGGSVQGDGKAVHGGESAS